MTEVFGNSIFILKFAGLLDGKCNGVVPPPSDSSYLAADASGQLTNYPKTII